MSSITAALVNGAIAGAVLAALVWLALRAVPRQGLNAATKYVVWWAALILVTALPLLYFWAGRPRTTAVRVQSVVIAGSAEPGMVSGSEQFLPPAIGTNLVKPVRAPRFPLEITGGRVPEVFLSLWMLTAFFMLARLGISYALLESRKTRAFAVPADLSAKLQTWLARCGTRRKVRLACSTEIATPIAAGLRNPSILIPARLLGELQEDEMDQIGLHEAAHLARRDDLALVIQRVLEALFPFHPVVRWIARRIDLEREIACDDFVVAATGRARPYAACLTHVLELKHGMRGSPVAAAAIQEGSHLTRRVEMLLDKSRHTGTRLLKGRLAGLVAALMMLAWFAAKTPRLVAFTSPQTQVSMRTQPTVIAEPLHPASAVEPLTSSPILLAQAAPQPKTAPASPSSAEDDVMKVDEAYRLAKLNRDTQALDGILADAFYETNQNGNSRDKAQTIELWKSFSINSLTTDTHQVQVAGDTAKVAGTQTEDGDRMLFTRVYVKTPAGWRLLASMQFRDPHPSAGLISAQPAAAPSVEDDVMKADEAYRLAKLNRDTKALDQILTDAFSETNQNGNTRDKAWTIELWKSFTVHSLTTDTHRVRLAGDTAMVTGTQTEDGDRMLFTRVYVNSPTGWRLLSSMQFRTR